MSKLARKLRLKELSIRVLNRDILGARLAQEGVRPVRQVSIDPVWNALRFRPA